MKLLKLIIDNFKNFYGSNKFVWDSSITFANKLNFENTNNTLIIKANNGVGKTSFLDALSYLFTSKNIDGKTLGMNSLNIFNEVVNEDIYIDSLWDIDGKEIAIKYDKGKRFINNVLMKNKNEFATTLKQLNIVYEDIENYINPLKIFINKTTQELRQMLFDKLLNEQFFNTLEADCWDNEILCDDTELTFKTLHNLKLMSITKLIENTTKQLNDKNKEIKLLLDLKAQISTINWSEQDAQEIEKLENLVNTKKDLQYSLNHLISETNKDICSMCKRPYDNTQNNKEIITTQINTLKAQIAQFDENHINIEDTLKTLKYHRDKYLYNSEFLKTYDDKIDKLNDEYNLLKQEQTVQEIILDKFISLLDINIKNILPFDVKLFHVNKNKTIKDTFELTYQGVDYSFMNSAQKLICANAFNSFFIQSHNMFQVIDNCEMLDNESLTKILQSNPFYKIMAFVEK